MLLDGNHRRKRSAMLAYTVADLPRRTATPTNTHANNTRANANETVGANTFATAIATTTRVPPTRHHPPRRERMETRGSFAAAAPAVTMNRADGWAPDDHEPIVTGGGAQRRRLVGAPMGDGATRRRRLTAAPSISATAHHMDTRVMLSRANRMHRAVASRLGAANVRRQRRGELLDEVALLQDVMNDLHAQVSAATRNLESLNRFVEHMESLPLIGTATLSVPSPPDNEPHVELVSSASQQHPPCDAPASATEDAPPSPLPQSGEASPSASQGCAPAIAHITTHSPTL